MKYLLLFEDREGRNLSLFSESEAELFDDLLTEYIDKYQIKLMPCDLDGYYYFDDGVSDIQYLIQRLRNISINIESISSVPLDILYKDIKNNFVQRIEKYGYRIYHCSLSKSPIRNEISITISKN